MNDLPLFGRLVDVLSPWNQKLVFVGGWAHRLYRLHHLAEPQNYPALATLDADVAFAERERLEGSIKARLIEAGFKEELTGEHRPPVSRYVMGEEAAGFYAEFLTPLTGSGRTRDGNPDVTVQSAGITAQRLRHLDLLLASPWTVELDAEWGVAMPTPVRVPNPVSFMVQKLLIRGDRSPKKRAQDVLYVYDTLQLFGADPDSLREIWHRTLKDTLHKNSQGEAVKVKNELFGQVNDITREAAQIAGDRDLDPERIQTTCKILMGRILD